MANWFNFVRAMYICDIAQAEPQIIPGTQASGKYWAG